MDNKSAASMASAWEKWSQISSLPHFLNIPPDTVIVLENQGNRAEDNGTFFVHRAILTQHCGYFKKIFLTSPPISEIRVKNIRSETFSYILTYMYTGGLLTLSSSWNVYEILQASNLLQINYLAKQCENFLCSNSIGNIQSCGIIKPVPLRGTSPGGREKLESMKYQPLRIDNTQPSIFKPVDHGFQAPPNEDKLAGSSHEHKNKKKVDGETESDTKKSGTLTGSSSIIYDVAYCDGPIKFHKITNQFYKPSQPHFSPPRNYSNFFESFEQKERNSFDALENSIEKKQPHKNVNSTSIKNSHKPVGGKKIGQKNGKYGHYLCKICGSKFPSYYFVNKHRKVCGEHKRDI